MDTAHWPQEIVVKPIEEIVANTCPKPPTTTHHVGVNGGAIERKARPQKEQALNCPRCNSTNTKFCYYNNYSLTQPRYFCKTCRRYWTEGGSLRNIPVGGGSRKNKRQSLSTTITSSSLSNHTNNIMINTSSSKTKLPDLVTPPLNTTHHQNPSKIHEGQDLNLAYPSTQGIRTFSDLISLPTTLENTKNSTSTTTATATTTTSCQLSALELLTGISSRGLNSFMPMQIQDPNTVYSTSATSGFISPLQDFKPSLSFSLEGLGSGGGNNGGYGNLQESSGRILFPFEDLKQVSTTTTTSDQIQQNRDHNHHHHHNNQGDSTGYWTGMLGGGSW